jgi:poly[(R)-3-hydroxyalkanoate] polymerase subunit PhaE
MAHQDNSIVDSIVDTQKKVLDTIVENTKKFSSGNHVVSDSIDKGTEWYKNWLEDQKNIFTKTTEKVAGTTETVKESASKVNEFAENWYKTQMDSAKQMWEMNQEWAKNLSKGNTSTNPFNFNAGSNPFGEWQNKFSEWQKNMNNMHQWNSWMNNFSGNNNWMNQMQNSNPFSGDTWKKSTESLTGVYDQYYKMLNNNFADWQKSFENGTVEESYKNMINIGEGFTKFAQMWEPMMKSIQDKTFNMDQYKKAMNPDVYKEMMDKYLGLLPEGNREYIKNFTEKMTEGMKQMTDAGTNSFNQFKNKMGTQINGSEVFGNMLNEYNKWHNSVSEAAAPFTKMMPVNDQTKALNEWNDISNRIMVYNIKNAELQYLIYTQGTKVMDALAENVAKKVKDGTEVKSVIALYQEWLNISDKSFVTLFESDEYSKLMAEVGSLKMKLQKDIELQMETNLKGIPVATRSEIDELYKTIYDLKKKVHQMEKMMDLDSEIIPDAAGEAKPAAKKSAKK